MPIALIYHDVCPHGQRAATGFQGPGPDSYKLTPELFEAHLDVLGDALPTFDDGGASALSTIAPALERRGRTGVFFVTTARVGTPGFLDANGVRELRERGHLVGGHGHTHRALTSLDDAAIESEWRTSREQLEELLGEPVVLASVPTGFFERRVAAAAARAGVSTLYTSEPWATPRELAGIAVHGRFSVKASTPADRVAALARADRRTLVRERALWEAKKTAKRAAGPLYARARSVLLARR